MHPAALLTRGAEYLRQRFPKAQRAITNGYFRIDSQPALFQVQQEFFPRLCGLATRAIAPRYFWCASNTAAEILELNLSSPWRSRPRRLHHHIADPCLDGPLRLMTVTHHPLTPAFIPQRLIARDHFRYLGFYGLLQQSAGPASPNYPVASRSISSIGSLPRSLVTSRADKPSPLIERSASLRKNLY